MSDTKSMDAEAWIAFAACVALAVAYFAPVSGRPVQLIGAAVAAFGLGSSVRYAIGDNKGRNWRGMFLPLAMGLAGLKLLFQ